MSNKDTTTAITLRFYTLQELTDLGVGSESALRKAIKDGRLSFHRFGTAYRIHQDDLDAYLTAARRPTPQLFDGFVDAVVDAAPRLTHEQRQQLITVLGGANQL